MSVDPRVSFWLGVVVTVTLAVGNGTVTLTHAIPDSWIPVVVAWNQLLAVLGSAILTALHGVSAPHRGPLLGEEE